MVALSAPLTRLLFDAGLAKSRNDARRLIQAGAITVDGVIVTDIDAEADVRAVLAASPALEVPRG